MTLPSNWRVFNGVVFYLPIRRKIMIITNRTTAGVGLLRARVPAVRMLTRVARSPMHVLAVVSDAVRTSHVYAHAFVRACTDGYRSSNASHRRQTHRHTCRDIIGRLYVLHEHAAVHTYIHVLRDKKDSAKLFARSNRMILLFQQHSPTEMSTFRPHVGPRSNFISASILSSFDIE